MSRSKRKSSSDVAGTAKKGQAITMETKVKIIVGVARQKDGRCQLFYNMNHSAISTTLRTRSCKVCSASDVHNNIEEAVEK